MVGGLEVVPNPFDDYFSVIIAAGKAEGNSRIEVLNLEGKTMWQDQLELGRGKQSLEVKAQLASGIYLLRLTSKTEVRTQKIIKR